MLSFRAGRESQTLAPVLVRPDKSSSRTCPFHKTRLSGLARHDRPSSRFDPRQPTIVGDQTHHNMSSPLPVSSPPSPPCPRKQSPCRTFVANREGLSTNLHKSTRISIRENSCQFVDRTRKVKTVARASRLRTRQARPSRIFAGSKGCPFSVVILYTSTLIRPLSFASPAGNGSSQPANQLRRFTFCMEDRFFVLSA